MGKSLVIFIAWFQKIYLLFDIAFNASRRPFSLVNVIKVFIVPSILWKRPILKIFDFMGLSVKNVPSRKIIIIIIMTSIAVETIIFFFLGNLSMNFINLTISGIKNIISDNNIPRRALLE